MSPDSISICGFKAMVYNISANQVDQMIGLEDIAKNV